MKIWHQLSPEEAARQLDSDPKAGLSKAEAQARLAKYGKNEITEPPSASPLLIFLQQFKDTMIIVLLAAAAISGIIGELNDTLFILAIVLINALLSTSQQLRAERAVAALKKLSAPLALVIREGETQKIPSREIVLGDLIILEAGAKIQADARLIETYNLKIDESSLTGESVPVEKQIRSLAADNIPLGDRTNLVFTGTAVTYGRGKALVVACGMETQLGRIAKMIEEEPGVTTPLQERFAYFGKWLAVIALSICALIFLAGIWRGEDWVNMFLTAVSLAVAAIPEGLPAVVTIALALGAYRLVKRHAIIRKLPAVETLGSVTVICSDKTGTLTQNKMVVRQVYSEDRVISVSGEGYQPRGKFLLYDQPLNLEKEPSLRLQLLAGLLCNDAQLSQEGIWGDPTEGSLVVLAAKAGLDKAESEKLYPRVAEIPFDSDRKLMTTVHSNPAGGYCCFTKGALGAILKLCNLEEEEKVVKVAENLARSGMRILGLAYKRTLDAKPEERNLQFLGFVAMSDPPRPEVKAAILSCQQAHIRPIMITGDHKLTALAIARELGLAEHEGEVMEGSELDKVDLKKIINKINVFARVSPEHKLRIVLALKDQGEIVAMTGDGVNDAPALKKADIGVAMGIAGTDVAKEASDMILTDDNFASIVAAVEEGRGIYDNIKKFVRYMLTTNSGEILTMFGSILLRLPLPILPVQILWVNLVTDGLPALALSVEPAEADIMRRPPRDPKEKISAGGLLYSMLGIGVLMAAGTLGLFYLGLKAEGLVKARTLAFTALSFFQMSHVLNCKSLNRSLFRTGLFSNLYLILAIFSTIIMQMAVVYLPPLQGVFKTTALSFAELFLVIAVASTPILAVEARKKFNPK
jgi:Ca2+-transporting ATPase